MLMVERLTVHGFKSIRALEDFELRGLNVLIGPNGAGKSNFISLFQMVGGLFAKRLQQFVSSEDGPDALLFGGRKRTQTIAIELTISDVNYRIALTPASGTLRVASEEVRFPGGARAQRFDSGLVPSVRSHAGQIEGRVEVDSRGLYEREARLPGADLGRDASWSYVCSAVGSWRHVYHFHDTSDTAPIRQAQAARDNLVLKPDAGNLAPFLRRLRERHPAPLSADYGLDAVGSPIPGRYGLSPGGRRAHRPRVVSRCGPRHPNGATPALGWHAAFPFPRDPAAPANGATTPTATHRRAGAGLAIRWRLPCWRRCSNPQAK